MTLTKDEAKEVKKFTDLVKDNDKNFEYLMIRGETLRRGEAHQVRPVFLCQGNDTISHSRPSSFKWR